MAPSEYTSQKSSLEDREMGKKGRRLLARVLVTGLKVPVRRIAHRYGFLPTKPSGEATAAKEGGQPGRALVLDGRESGSRYISHCDTTHRVSPFRLDGPEPPLRCSRFAHRCSRWF